MMPLFKSLYFKMTDNHLKLLQIFKEIKVLKVWELSKYHPLNEIRLDVVRGLI